MSRHTPLLVAALLLLAACETPGPSGSGAPPASTGAAEPASAAAPPTSTPLGAAPPATAPPPAQVTSTLPDETAALGLARAFVEAAGRKEGGAFLKAHAAWPLDLDGKIHLLDALGFDSELARHVPALDAEVAPNTTCEATTRDALLQGGQRWHWLDRLGKRPPRDELARDLDRFGVTPTDQLVNCYAGEGAGFTLLVTRQGADLRVRSFRN